MSMNTIQLPDFGNYRVYVVYGDGLLNTEQLFSSLGIESHKAEQLRRAMRSHVFAETEHYLAVVLLPKELLEGNAAVIAEKRDD